MKNSSKEIFKNAQYACKYFVYDRPCTFHKQYGMNCQCCEKKKEKTLKIVIIKLDAVGDVLRSTSILGPLSKKYKNANITWLTRKNALPIFENNDKVNRVLALEDAETQLIIMKEKFDLVFSVDANYASMLVASCIKTKEKIGFFLSKKQAIKIYPKNNKYAYEWLAMGLNDTLKKKNQLSYQDIILKICNLPNKKPDIIINLSEEEKKWAHGFFKTKGIQPNEFIFIGVNPGSGRRWPTKRWPVQNYIFLIKRLCRYYKNVKFLLYGGEEDQSIITRIVDAVPACAVDTGVNDLRHFFALLNLCDILISADTMALHAAIALNKKIVAMFGPTSHAEVSLYDKGKKLYANIPCLSCYKGICDKNMKCMKGISINTVFNAIKEISTQSVKKPILRS